MSLGAYLGFDHCQLACGRAEDAQYPARPPGRGRLAGRMEAYGWVAAIVSLIGAAVWGVTAVARKIVDAKDPVIEAIRALRAVRDEFRGSGPTDEITQRASDDE